MNYLTNYYKNLSEKLQAQVNLLESKAQQLNEAIATSTVYGNRPMSAGDSNGGFMYGDYNGDGRVDGADLGIALGGYGQPGYDFQGVLQNWTGNMSAAGPAFRSARIGRGSQSGVGAGEMSGGYGGAARPSVSGRPTMSDVGPAGAFRGDGRTNTSPVSGGRMVGGGALPGDYNGDGRVDGEDVTYVLANWGRLNQNDLNTVNSNFGGRFGPPAQFRSASSTNRARGGREIELAGGYGGQQGGAYDLNGDGRVDGADLGLMLGNYDQYGNAGISNLIGNWSGPDSGVGVPSLRSSTFSRPKPGPRPQPSKGTNLGSTRR